MINGKIKPGLPEQEAAGKPLAGRKVWRAVAVLLLFCLIAGGGAFLLFGMRRVLFSANRRFELKTLEIVNGSYWKGRERERQLCLRIGLLPGRNLFSIDYALLRRKIEAIPGIENCEVVRILPDKIRIKVTERIPRAILFNPRGKFVVDENAVVIPRNESAPQGELPVITSIPGRKSFRLGETLEPLRPSVDLIMMTLRNFPDINIVCAMPSDSQKLDFVMRYRGGKLYRVTIPIRNRGLPYLLSALQTAIINAHWKQLNVSGFNLLFDGRVVLK